MKRSFLVQAVAAVLLAAAFSACPGRPGGFRYTAPIMGTQVTVTVYGQSEEAAAGAFESALAELERINELMSNWLADSSLQQLNRAAAAGWAQTDPEVFELLRLSLEYSQRSGGAFDVTAGPLVRLWGFFRREERRPPSPQSIAVALTQVGYSKIELDAERCAVRFAPGPQGEQVNLEIDFGGAAKGYAVDRALEALKSAGVKSALVNLGGNIRAVGAPPGRQRWSVAVRDPRDRAGTIGTLELGGEGVASSGQYENFFEFEGRRYGHIIDPRAGWPVEGVLGTTIVAPDATTADILSTAAFVLGRQDGPQLIRDQAGVEGLLVLGAEDGSLSIFLSEGLRDRFKLNPALAGAEVTYF